MGQRLGVVLAGETGGRDAGVDQYVADSGRPVLFGVADAQQVVELSALAERGTAVVAAAELEIVPLDEFESGSRTGHVDDDRVLRAGQLLGERLAQHVAAQVEQCEVLLVPLGGLRAAGAVVTGAEHQRVDRRERGTDLIGGTGGLREQAEVRSDEEGTFGGARRARVVEEASALFGVPADDDDRVAPAEVELGECFADAVGATGDDEGAHLPSPRA